VSLTELAGLISQILSSLFIFVVSVTLLNLQIASELYTIRISRIFFRREVWAYYLLLLAGVLFSVAAPDLLFLFNDSTYFEFLENLFRSLLYILLLTGFLGLFWYIIYVRETLNPRRLIESLGRDLVFAAIEISSGEEFRGDLQKMVSNFSSLLSGIVELIRSVLERGDKEAAEMALGKLTDCLLRLARLRFPGHLAPQGAQENPGKTAALLVERCYESILREFLSRGSLVDLKLAFEIAIECLEKVKRADREPSRILLGIIYSRILKEAVCSKPLDFSAQLICLLRRLSEETYRRPEDPGVIEWLRILGGAAHSAGECGRKKLMNEILRVRGEVAQTHIRTVFNSGLSPPEEPSRR